MSALDAITAAGVRGLQPYQPGKPVETLERELGISEIIKLASNENPKGPGILACKAVRELADGLARYPDGSGHRLKAVLAERFGVNARQITLGNGSNDVLELVTRCFVEPGQGVVVSDHAFAVYTLAARSVNANISSVPAVDFGHDLEAMALAINPNTRVIFIANPNNPTGTYVGRSQLLAFLEGVPQHVITVLDEAYFEYVAEKDYPNGLDLIEQFPGLVVMRTFSKVYGLAGLRVGYAVASEPITEVLNRVRQPFNVNTLGLAAAEAALDDQAYVRESVAENEQGYAQLCAGFEKLGLRWIPSYGNFVCVEVGPGSQGVYEAMLHQGVIVRPVANYRLPEHLRITVGLATENQRALCALEHALEKQTGL